MKKFKIISMILALVLLVSAPVQAAQDIVLGNIRATITLPDGWERLANEEGLVMKALSPQGVMMVLTAQSGKVSENQWNLALYEDEDCEELIDSLKETLTEGGYENVTGALYTKEKEKWLKFTWEKTAEDGTKKYGLQFYTAMNGQAYTLAFSGEEPIDEADPLAIVDSIYFAEIQERPSAAEKEWKTRIFWIVLLVAGGAFTYYVTTRRAKKGA